MALPLKIHCERCGLPQWLVTRQAARVRRLNCPRCGHRAASGKLRLIRQVAVEREQPELRLAS
jgi:uncharacterized Zn finger protein (UPF0148 family)